MPVATKPQPRAKPASEPRAVLKPAGNRVAEDPKGGKKENLKKKPQGRPRKEAAPEIPDSVVRSNVSLDGTCSSDSSCCSSKSNASAKKVNKSSSSVKRKGRVRVRVRFAPDALDVATLSPTPKASGPPKRCDWITPNTGNCASPHPPYILSYFFLG